MTNRCIAAVLAGLLMAGATAATAAEPHGAMLRYPDVSKTHIAFLYANDLWLVEKGGGTAVPLASPPGEESFPRFNPDGTMIAFMGNYDGDIDIYTMPLSGGVPFRVTHHPANELLSDWTDDGRLIFSAYGMQDYPRAQEMFIVSAQGGLPEKMPVPYGALGRISPDGKWLVYTPHTRDQRTWKRYRGGMATDIWLFNLENHSAKKITDWEGTDTQPMWQGNKIYYLSDEGPSHRLNIWVYDVSSGERRQVTKYSEYDVKWPSNGPGSNGEGEIVFQYGPEIRLLNLETEQAATVHITIPGDRPKIRVHSVDASELIYNRNVSSTGKRAVVEARGDIWTLPAKKGSPLNLNRTSGVAERDPAWSPDGKSIAYFSDETGEYQLYVTQSDGRGETRKITDGKYGFLYQPVWSPDSKWIAFWDKAGVFYIVDVESRKTRTVDRFKAWGRTEPISWSSDSNWIAYTLADGMIQLDAIRLYNVKEDKKYQVTSGMFDDSWPTFDRKGKYLFFASNRDFSSPLYEDLGTTWIYAKTDRLYAVPLTKEIASPMPPKSDDESWDKEGEKEDKKDEEKKEKKDEKEGEGKEEESEPVKIDIDGFESRAVQLPVDRGEFYQLSANDGGQLIYVRGTIRGEDGEASIRILDLEAEKDEDRDKEVVSGVRGYSMSADGKKLLVVDRKGNMAIIDAKADQKMKDMVPTSGMTKRVDPPEEWQQIFREAWRIQRDYFYDPNMHGVDWDKVYKQYEAMLADCASREDVSYVIREMISELNVGHSYYFGGDVEHSPSVSVGMPGCDFELANGAYRITRKLEGGPWDVDGRGPLSQPGIDVKVGDYLLAVNGVPVDTAKDPWAAFLGLAGRTVTLTVSENPKLDDKARYVLVELGQSDYMLRYRAWVEKNRAYVSEQTGGRVGYIYVPNTSIFGQDELVRQFFGQTHLDALIVDERWNGGGQIPTRFVELLNRPIANYWALRDRDDTFPWPPDAQQGPKCMLINGLAGSGGDYFPFWFKAAGVGKLIGTRTWGGLVGISGNPALIDGGYTSAPTFAFFKKNGTWGIEGHGVDPDIEVIDDPSKMYGGKDVQLDAAIQLMQDELKTNPYKKPKRPPYPDRSGMGVKDKDK
jgi:tricorn protease